MSPFTAHTISSLSWIWKIKKLAALYLEQINLYGEIPPSIETLSQLVELSFLGNQLSGTIPSQLGNLTRLTRLSLRSNQLSGSIPSSLMSMTRLVMLDLAVNKFHGEIPSSISQLQNLQILLLVKNNFSGTVELDNFSSSNNYLSHNVLQGPPPEAPPSIMFYLVSNNRLTGALSPWICNLSLAIALNLSSNDLTGVLPVCLGNISESLMILSLKGNNFRGNIPKLLVKGTQLTMLDLSDNQLQGNLPRSLANCKMLEFINFANNLIVDSFPSWLGSLPELCVLILRSNKFHYVIERLNLIRRSLSCKYLTSLLMHLPISKALIVIDLSSNLFEGEIPGAIGDLKGLRGLNLSNNLLTGHIPPSLGNLKALESLDLSLNKLSGQIPQKLTELGFLSFLNMSYNNLTGSVPKGKQFDTFLNDSFEGNLGLCGEFISTKCQDSRDKSRQPSTHQEERLGSPIELDWKIVLLGYGAAW
ncbi:receptor-like protein 54 [Rutidosis leptorrhynchoides]|uniref:receptor-like protein 54 n=1 Tax=Rutidosis leptorrhynchoides TaxID=125765 RepID=UPI003A99541B